MDWILILQVVMAVMFLFFIIKVMPHFIQQIKHGPKGSAKDWLGVTVPLLAVTLFVALLIYMKQS